MIYILSGIKPKLDKRQFTLYVHLDSKNSFLHTWCKKAYKYNIILKSEFVLSVFIYSSVM